MTDAQQTLQFDGAVLHALTMANAVLDLEWHDRYVARAHRKIIGSLLGESGIVASASFAAGNFSVNSAYSVARGLRIALTLTLVLSARPI